MLLRRFSAGLRRRLSTQAAAAVEIVEVGPRDGLQNEPSPVSTETKLDLIDRLTAAGLRTIEATAFVAPKWVPQMADHAQLLKRIAKQPGVRYPVLVPNLKGLEIAQRSGAEDIAVFTAASEAFVKRNINSTIEESLASFAAVAETALAAGLRVRGYVSTIVGCPYEGRIAPEKVLRVTEALLGMGCYEVSLGDTIGVATPGELEALLSLLLRSIPASQLALHCHDTYGQALANCLRGYQMGIRTFDASVAGLGGCPYAKGASGNVATEDLVYMLEGLGASTGCDLEQLIMTGAWISRELGREPQSRVTKVKMPKEIR